LTAEKAHDNKLPILIIDVGTALTKVGIAEEVEFPHIHEISTKDVLGECPLKNGVIENWDLMQAMWEKCIFNTLKCDPKQSSVLLPFSPLNLTQPSVYKSASIFFETLEVQSLDITFAPAHTLTSSWVCAKQASLTGLVVDFGESITQVVPIVEGYGLSDRIRYFPFGGATVT